MDFEQKLMLWFSGAACMVGTLLLFEGAVLTGVLAIVWGAACVALACCY